MTVIAKARRRTQTLAGVLALLHGQYARAIPLAPRGLACGPQGEGCPWHDRTAVMIYYAVWAAVFAAAVIVLRLRATEVRRLASRIDLIGQRRTIRKGWKFVHFNQARGVHENFH
jgi:hypothetical protein